MVKRRGVKKTMRLHVKCPNCREPLFGTKTDQKIATFTEVTYECRNECCNARYVYGVEALRILNPPTVLINQDLKNIKLSPVLAQTLEKIERMNVSDDTSDFQLVEHAMPKDDLFPELLVAECSALTDKKHAMHDSG